MNKTLWSNVRINILFYKRNRLLLVAGLLLFVVLLISIVPSFFFTSVTDRFDFSLSLYNSLSFFLFMTLALIGLITLWYHRSNKCIKLVFAKPCTPEEWLLSHYVSAGLVFTCGLAIAVALFLVSCLMWGIPIQQGILALALLNFSQAYFVFALLLLLTEWMHPIIAVVVSLVFSDSLFYSLAHIVRAAHEDAESTIYRAFLYLMQWLVEGLYYLIPSPTLLDSELTKLESSLRLVEGNLWHLGMRLAYLVVFVAFAFILTAHRVRNRPVI